MRRDVAIGGGLAGMLAAAAVVSAPGQVRPDAQRTGTPLPGPAATPSETSRA